METEVTFLGGKLTVCIKISTKVDPLVLHLGNYLKYIIV